MKTTYHLHICNQLDLTGSWDQDQFQNTGRKVCKIPNSGWMRTNCNWDCWCKHPNKFQCCRQFLDAKHNPVMKNVVYNDPVIRNNRQIKFHLTNSNNIAVKFIFAISLTWQEAGIWFDFCTFVEKFAKFQALAEGEPIAIESVDAKIWTCVNAVDSFLLQKITLLWRICYNGPVI